ncbi:MAG: CBS domain-containing protein [Ktedonobacteraceae bacterium]|nr:CBS domain-containing protein [Ktedonobacteraceae bacterium]
MIIRDIMTTRLVTVEPDDTLAHAANLLRQHQFHHLPVARKVYVTVEETKERKLLLVLEGILTSQDIDVAVAVSEQDAGRTVPWQERKVGEVMHQAALRVTPTTSVAAAAQVLVERGLNYLPVVEFGLLKDESRSVLVGLVTRSDLLLALSRAMGAFEPGMQLDIALPAGDLTPIVRVIQLAAELQVPIRCIMAAPLEGRLPQVATLRLGTINPAPLLKRLQEAGVHYTFGSPLGEGNAHA